MTPLPLNIQTLFADLQQKMVFAERLPAAISRKTVRGHRYVYAQEKHGSDRRVERLLGKEGDPAVEAEAEALKAEAANAKLRRQLVSMLKQALVPAPTLAMGKVLEALSRAGYFDHGMILVGTLAYGTYSPLLGYQLSAGALMTQDADFAIASIAAMSDMTIGGSNHTHDHDDDDSRPKEAQGDNRRAAKRPIMLPDVLLRADPTFRPLGGLGRRIGDDRSADLPKHFRAQNGLEVELLTPVRNRDDEDAGGVPIPAIGAAAIPLRFLDFLLTDAVTTTALYNAGVKLKVPQPARYAAHKLIVAQRRNVDMTKRTKDLAQAKELIGILRQVDEGALDDALNEARSRGRTWETLLDTSMKAIGDA
jgi:hypothetical protein